MACLRTFFFARLSVSNLMASTQSLVEWSLFLIAFAAITFALCPSLSRMASSHASSLFGQSSHPLAIVFLAVTILPASSSNRARAIHPGACFGFVFVTDSSKTRTRLMSLISTSPALSSDCVRFVRYPFGSMLLALPADASAGDPCAA